MDRRAEKMEAEFLRRYGRPPSLLVRAPGRVDLMGSHTDYNMGFVLTMAIERDTWIAASPRDDRVVCVQSLDVEGGGSFHLDHVVHDPVAPWTDYVRGVAQALSNDGFGLYGWDGLFGSTVPIGSGLSSSAAIEVATAMVFRALGGWSIDPLRMALLCQRAENEFVGMQCGILDQYSSLMGQARRALLLDCRALTSDRVLLPENLRVVICDTRSKRALTGSEYPERRAQCEEGARRLSAYYPHVRALRDVSPEQFARREADLPLVVARRCRFIVEENQRVLGLAQALPQGNRTVISSNMAASYEGARDLYEITSPEMEAMMDAMRAAPGVVGARQAGAGFGGCMVAIVDSGKVTRFSQRVAEKYEALTGIAPAVYPTAAAPGAGPVRSVAARPLS